MFDKENILKDRIEKALKVAWSYGQIDDANYKMWVIDQMVRALCGGEKEYEEWVIAYETPIANGEYYVWHCGVAP